MGRVKSIEVKESAAELLQLSRKISHPLAQARLRAYYLYQSGQERNYDQLAATLGYERHTIGKWFQLYRGKGLAACLTVDPGGKPTGSVIAGQVLEQLQQKLQDPVNYFTSYKQIQQWLQQEHWKAGLPTL